MKPVLHTLDVETSFFDKKSRPSSVLKDFLEASRGDCLAHGTQQEHQTLITGLADTGVAPDSRHRLSEFGSGWQGLGRTDGVENRIEPRAASSSLSLVPGDSDGRSEDQVGELAQIDAVPSGSNLWRGIGLVGVAVGVNATHRFLARHSASYRRGLYQAARVFEERSPYHIGRTFAFSELLSSYLVEDVHIARERLIRSGVLTAEGQHFDRLLGGQLRDRLAESQEGLQFTRADKGDPYAYIVGGNHPAPRMGIRFTEADVRREGPHVGRLSASSSRKGAGLFEYPLPPTVGDNPLERARNWYHNVRTSQRPSASYKGLFQAEGLPAIEARGVRPYLGKVEGQTLRNTLRKLDYFAFENLEHMQRLGADVGIGLKKGTYNQVAHIPFFAGAGERGLVNQVMLRRVLPVALGITAIKYGDYLLGHKPSEALVAIPAKLEVLHAQATQGVPGLRALTDTYQEVVPGPQYGPLALPVLGATAGALFHYSKVVLGKFGEGEIGEEARRISGRVLAKEGDQRLLRFLNRKSPIAWGLLAGVAAMLPFVPGMLGARRTPDEVRSELSGETPVAIRSGRWWDLGTTPFAGGRIKEYRPHWYALHRAHARERSLYGSEEGYWEHNPLLHPLRWLRDPYYLERMHYKDRPYPVTSPAFADVPLVGPLLAATIGKVVKPVRYMHSGEWDRSQYSLYSTRLEPKGGAGLPPPEPVQEFGLKHTLEREAKIFSEYIGLPGFLMSSIYNEAFPDKNIGQRVFLEGSRQIDSLARNYYERELGAGLGPSPEGSAAPFGYSEPLRRYIQRETGIAQANEIPNEMPHWLPGDDYFINFRVGDPFAKTTNAYARLPGPGYAALHPELTGVAAKDYPDFHKFQILADVAPYSKEFATLRGRIARAAQSDTQLEIEYDKVIERVRQMKDSVIQTDERRFTGATDEITGRVQSATPEGLTLEEYPGRRFTFSSVGHSAADLSAVAIGAQNDLSRDELVAEVRERQKRLTTYLDENLSGEQVRLTVARGAVEHAEVTPAVVNLEGKIVNRSLIEEGLGVYRRELGGAEARALYGPLERALGTYAETVSFMGDEGPLNPLRYLPSPGHTKLWQEHTAFSEYLDEEVIGTRMRRWQKPLHDFLAPYLRGLVKRTTGATIIPQEVERRRDLNTLSDVLQYLRAERDAASRPEQRGKYTSQASRTSVGANQFSSPTFLSSTLPDREAHYFRKFLAETNPERRKEILSTVPAEMARSLSSQWVATDARIARAEGRAVPEIGEGGRLYSEAALSQYSQADTKLGYGDYERSQEIAQFFARTGFHLPEGDSSVWNDVQDYEDVKLKIIQQEGYDAHDFNIFDDRAALLWRKPWVTGAARELTSGGSGATEDIRRSVEQMILAAKGNSNPNAAVVGAPAVSERASVTVDVDLDQQSELERDMRRNPERYEEQ